MISDKQLEANRANAQKSTGPSSEEGKARAARNAHRHRALAESLLLESENPDRFCVFARRFYLEHQPKGPTERMLLDMVISARWRLLRLSHLEAVGVDHEFNLLRAASAEITIPRCASQAYTNSGKSGALRHLNSMESRLQRQFDSAFDRFSRLIATRRSQTSANHPEVD